MNAQHLISAMAALAAALPALAGTPATSAPAAVTAQRKAPELSEQTRLKADVLFGYYKEFGNTLQSIDDEATAEAAVPRLHALNNAFEHFLSLPAEERKQYLEYYSTSRREEMLDTYSVYKGAALWLSGTELLVTNDALAYELLIRQHPASGFFDDCGMTISTILMNQESNPDPALTELVKKHLAAHKADHDAFLKAHADIYAGGDGSSEEEAIVLLPYVQGKADTDDEDALENLINEYLCAVYPDGEAAYAFMVARPDGAFFHYRQIIFGLYTGSDGKRHMQSQRVYFQTKQP